jgi:vancomycin resistance protein VanJ
VALSLIAIAIPQRAGPIAGFLAVAPIAYGVLLVALLPLAVLRRDAVLAAGVAGACLMAALIYAAPEPPARVTATEPVTVMTWNLHGEPTSDVGLEAALARWDPDVVVLQEARSDAAGSFGTDMQTMHHPGAGTAPGMVLATRLPILDSGGALDTPVEAWDRPRAFWMTLDAGSQPLIFVGAHLSVPFPVSSLPCPYCPTLRDRQVAALAAFAAERVAAGDSVIVAGDLNLTQREVAYDDLAELVDVARGGTWRPFPLSWLPPFLRLDFVLTGPDIGVVAADVDCAGSASDHCAVVVQLALP